MGFLNLHQQKEKKLALPEAAGNLFAFPWLGVGFTAALGPMALRSPARRIRPYGSYCGWGQSQLRKGEQGQKRSAGAWLHFIRL